MRFWDSSAIVPLIVAQRFTPAMRARLKTDGEMAVWWGSVVECGSAIVRLEREHHLSRSAATTVLANLDELAARWQEVQPVTMVREIARRLLRTHALRAADATQLAAALVVAEQRPASLEFVCLDDRLSEAAEKEGFPIVRS